MKSINLLMLGGGKRVSLLERFNRAADQLGLELNSFSYELNNQIPIGQFSEIVIGRNWFDKDIESDIKNLCDEKGIDLIISNVDQATVIQSRLRQTLHAASFCSSFESATICFSKKNFQTFCVKNELGIVPLAIEGQYPAFAKPNFGSASEGTTILTSREAKDSLSLDSDIIIQKYVRGIEFSVDAYVSRERKICGISPRIRHRTLGGESVETETVQDTEISQRTIQLINKLQLVGPLTAQFIREEVTNNLYLLEVNPRFAGGVIASIEAGFNFPRMMLEECIGLEPASIFKGRRLKMIRYFKEAFFEISD